MYSSFLVVSFLFGVNGASPVLLCPLICQETFPVILFEQELTGWAFFVFVNTRASCLWQGTEAGGAEQIHLIYDMSEYGETLPRSYQLLPD